MAIEVRPIGGGGPCLVCRDELSADVVVCAGCGARFHVECRAGLARCTTLGCAGAPPARPTPVAPPPAAAPALTIDPQAAAALAALARSSLPQGPALSTSPPATLTGGAPAEVGGVARVRRTPATFVPPRDLVAALVLCAVATLLVERTAVGYRLAELSASVLGRPLPLAWALVPAAWLAWRVEPGRRRWALALVAVQLALHQVLGLAYGVVPFLWAWGHLPLTLLEPGLAACLVGGLLGLFGAPPAARAMPPGGDAPDAVDLPLRPGERLLWVGAPDPALAARRGALQAGAVVAALALLGVVGAGGAAAVACVVAPFGLVLVAVVTGAAWTDLARTLYAVTTQRALAARVAASGAPDVRELLEVSRITDVWRGRGGDVLFFRTSRVSRGRRRTRDEGFRHLPDPAAAEAALREAAAGAAPRT